MITVSIVSGGFDPLHSGHIDYLSAASLLGDILIVGVNSDEWLVRKKGKFFLPLTERMIIVSKLKPVSLALDFDDTDGSAKQLITKVRTLFPTSKLRFCNGGDRTSSNIPEMDIADSNVEFVFEVGGSNKKNSSSWILKEWESKNS